MTLFGRIFPQNEGSRKEVSGVKPVRRKEAAPEFDAAMLDTAEGRS